MSNYQGLLFWKLKVCVHYNKNRARKSSKRAQLLFFNLYFSKFRVYIWNAILPRPLKQHVVLKVLQRLRYFTFETWHFELSLGPTLNPLSLED